MYQFILNGEKVSFEEDIKLIEYLREYKNLTSVKNGCSEGACGACMVLIDGKPVRSCITKISRIEGKEVITVEGLTEFEKQVYTWAFSKAGAVQCGFCTPGMIISTKALLDKTLNSSEEQIKTAIRGNICRCTGYVKIIKAIEMAAKIFREGKLPEAEKHKGKVGENIRRTDERDKILGIGKYVDDMKIEGMLYGSALRSKYPRALIKSIDISKALKHPEVEKIVTAKDVPGNRVIGHIIKQRACTHAAGPYRCPNVSIKGTAVYTNNPPAGAFRGFGVTESVFASECNLNLLAEKLDISPWEIRFRNAVEPGDVLPNGQFADEGTAIKETIIADSPDTFLTPDSGTSTASRQTLFAGEATRRAALKLKNRLGTKTLDECEGEEFCGEFEGVTDTINSRKKNPVSHVAYGYATQVVTLNEKGKVERVVAAHDVGKAINSVNLEGQIEGGVVMGLGYAFTEGYPLKKSVPTAKFLYLFYFGKVLFFIEICLFV